MVSKGPPIGNYLLDSNYRVTGDVI